MSGALEEALDALTEVVETPADEVDVDRAVLALGLISAACRTYPTKAAADVTLAIIEGDRVAALRIALMATGTLAAVELCAAEELDALEVEA
jgi:hypothetical protein